MFGPFSIPCSNAEHGRRPWDNIFMMRLCEAISFSGTLAADPLVVRWQYDVGGVHSKQDMAVLFWSLDINLDTRSESIDLSGPISAWHWLSPTF